VLPIPPSSSQQDVIQRPSSSPFPVSMPNSSHHFQVPNFPRNTRRHSSGSSTRQLPSLSFPPSTTTAQLNPASPSASPTNSLQMSVSDIHFRRMGTSEGGSLRTSAGSQALPPHPPLPRGEEYPPELPPTPFIVQKLLGMNTSGRQTPSRYDCPSSSRNNTTQTSILGSSSSVHPEPEPESSTPFMQRVLGFGAAALSPRHNRNASQDVLKSSLKSSSPKSSSSERSRR
jgi:hypothetical protein